MSRYPSEFDRRRFEDLARLTRRFDAERIYYRHLAEELYSGLATLSEKDLTIVWANRAFSRIIDEDAVGRRIDQVIRSNELLAGISKVLRSGPGACGKMHLRDDEKGFLRVSYRVQHTLGDTGGELEVTLLVEDLEPPRAALILVHDEDSFRDSSARALRAARCDVTEAASGQEAVGRAMLHDGRFQLLVTKMRLPDMEGLELADRLERRLEKPGSNQSVLFILQGELEIPSKGEYLLTPREPEEIVAKIAELLEKSAVDSSGDARKL